MSKDVQTCADPIRLTEAARRLGRSPRTLERWAKLGRFTIYRDDYTTTRFVSASEIDALRPRARGE